MLTQYNLRLVPESACRPRQEWGYHLYATLLEQSPEGFGARVHTNEVTPISQFLSVSGDSLLWTVSLLGETSEDALGSRLESCGLYCLHKDSVSLRVLDVRKRMLRDVDSLFSLADSTRGLHLLRFCTTTAFKSRGRYQTLPSSRLILQSLIKKWNSCITDCPIEDEDGEGMDAIASGLRMRNFDLHDSIYYLKGNSIPGFTGEVTIENRLSGFHRQLADALLLFAGYAGVGIKTTLGMGGVRADDEPVLRARAPSESRLPI